MRRHRGGGRPRHTARRGRAGDFRARRPEGLVWAGSILFGMVEIRVALRSGERPKGLPLTLLDRRDLSPIGYRKVNKTTGAEVPAGLVVRGYRRAAGEYVVLTDDDLRRASPERTQRIDLLTFVDGAKIDPALFERPYHLEPEARSEKAYVLLREALRRSGKVGIATVVLRERQHVAALMARGPALTLELLRYSTELRDPAELQLPDADFRRLGVSDAELKMADRLIEDLSGAWEPERYKDDYRDELLSFIEAKAGPAGGAPAVKGKAGAARRGKARGSGPRGRGGSRRARAGSSA